MVVRTRHNQIAMPTKHPDNIKNALTASRTSHVISKPKIVLLSMSKKDVWEIIYVNGAEWTLVQRFNVQHLLGQSEWGASSVPSPQWLIPKNNDNLLNLTLDRTLATRLSFIPSHIKSADMQNSDDLHRNSLHAWSERKVSIPLDMIRWMDLKCENCLLMFFMAVNTNLNPLASVPQPSVTYFTVKKLLWVIMLPTVCLVLRQDMSICWKQKTNTSKTFFSINQKRERQRDRAKRNESKKCVYFWCSCCMRSIINE